MKENNINKKDFLNYFTEENCKKFSNLDELRKHWIKKTENAKLDNINNVFREIYRIFLEECSINYLITGA